MMLPAYHEQEQNLEAETSQGSKWNKIGLGVNAGFCKGEGYGAADMAGNWNAKQELNKSNLTN